MGEGPSSHAADMRTRASPMSAKVPRVVRSVSRPPGTGILGRREREEAAILTGGCPRHASRRLCRSTHHNSNPDQTTHNAPRRALRTINLPPRREDSALTRPHRVARAAAAVAATAPALMVECRVRAPSSARRAHTICDHLAVHLLHRQVVAQLLTAEARSRSGTTW